MLLSQDESRYPMVPASCRTPGVKGHRPLVGGWDNKHLLYVFASVKVTSGALHIENAACGTGLYWPTGETKTWLLHCALDPVSAFRQVSWPTGPT